MEKGAGWSLFIARLFPPKRSCSAKAAKGKLVSQRRPPVEPRPPVELRPPADL